MAFSSCIYSLPSCSDYQGALRIWERRPVPRNKKNWPEGTRPLDDARKTHYAVIKDGNKIVFRLHRTNIVEWHSEDHFTLDSSYDSISTRNFAYRYLPHGINFLSLKEEGYCVKAGDAVFCRGIHQFRKFGHEWRCDSPTRKPRRSVLDPHKRKEINARLKPLTEWVKGLWAVCGNDGHHPWYGKEADVRLYPNPNVVCILADNVESYENVIKQYMPLFEKRIQNGTKTTWLRCYAQTTSEILLKRIRDSVYRQENAYIKIDYDAPLPTLKGKK